MRIRPKRQDEETLEQEDELEEPDGDRAPFEDDDDDGFGYDDEGPLFDPEEAGR